MVPVTAFSQHGPAAPSAADLKTKPSGFSFQASICWKEPLGTPEDGWGGTPKYAYVGNMHLWRMVRRPLKWKMTYKILAKGRTKLYLGNAQLIFGTQAGSCRVRIIWEVQKCYQHPNFRELQRP